jgi:beta-N-acetylhexosaminidase
MVLFYLKTIVKARPKLKNYVPIYARVLVMIVRFQLIKRADVWHVCVHPIGQNFPPRPTWMMCVKHMMAEGVNVDFAPCLDVIADGDQCDAIGDRCFSSDAKEVGEKGIQCCQGLMEAGVMPVIKHMPGHGHAVEDSHFFLPVVKANADELQRDLEPFKAVVASGLDVAGMTCHVIYEAWDEQNPATLSKTIIQNIIRGEIGFKGLLYSDDLAMKALDRYGDIVVRVQLCLDAGCDIALPCHTNLDETRAILEAL